MEIALSLTAVLGFPCGREFPSGAYHRFRFLRITVVLAFFFCARRGATQIDALQPGTDSGSPPVSHHR